MLKFLCDENFNGLLLRGLLRRDPKLDIVRVQDVGLLNAHDATILSWAEANDRILLTHDKSTVPRHALERIKVGQAMPGVFLVNDRMAPAQLIDDILLINCCSQPAEWAGRIQYLPL